MNNYCAEPQAHPDRCGCKPDAFQIARHSKRLVEQQRERIAALEDECERLADELDRKSVITGDYIARCQRLAAENARLSNSLLAITTRHFAESWKKRTSDAELEQYLSAGIAQLEAECERLRGEISDLHTTMMAAAVEIQEHWAAHCDEDGYGPNNLMYRLENGIAAQYGYTAQTIVRLEAERDTLAAPAAGQGVSALAEALERTAAAETAMRTILDFSDSEMRDGDAARDIALDFLNTRGCHE